MPGKLLIVNSHHPPARYVPMGTFGIAHHLEQQGHRARIWNGALYPRSEQDGRLEAEIRSFEPDLVGLIMQWKENTDTALALARRLRQTHSGLGVVAGGITAGYFAETLLRRHKFIDGVIRGDAELPLSMLLEGRDWAEVPNLLFREGNSVSANPERWLADCRLLDRLSFAGLEMMTDHQRYLEAIEPVLGVPVFIGRGCVFDCPYCGGSRSAFARHSDRSRPVFRSTAAVLADLRRLSRRTRTIYIGYENSQRYLVRLFRQVAEDETLAGRFSLNYGAWGLPRRDLLEQYARAFRTDGRQRPVIEISPETAIDEDRRTVRDPRLFFSNRQLTDCLETIRELIGGKVRVELYYSRYHSTQRTRERLEDELEGIHRLHEHLRQRGFGNVVVTNYHLATDTASGNWERFGLRDNGRSLDSLLRGLRQMRTPGIHQAPMDNLCLYTPEGLDPAEREAHDRLVAWLELLRRRASDAWFIAARVLGFRPLLDCIRSLLDRRRQAGWGEGASLHGLVHLLGALAREVLEPRHGLDPERAALVADLARLHAGHLASLACKEDGELDGLVKRPLLDNDRLCTTGWDLAGEAGRSLLDRDNAIPRKSPRLNVYCGPRIFAFPIAFEPQFRLFDGTRTLQEVVQAIGVDGSLQLSEIRDLTVFFTRFHQQFTR